MNSASRSAAVEACDCERPGPFFSGVPGVLGMMNDDGHLADGAVVERCDMCERFDSDADAFQRLVELGLADASEPLCAKTFTVRCVAVVRIEFPGVLAETAREAARQTLDRFDWTTHCRAEFADEITGLEVESAHDGGQPVNYNVNLNSVSPKSCPNCAWVFDDVDEWRPKMSDLSG